MKKSEPETKSMKFNKRVSVKFTIPNLSFLSVFFIALGFVLNTIFQTDIKDRATAQIEDNKARVNEVLNTLNANYHEMTKTAMNIFKETASAYGKPALGDNVAVKDQRVKNLYFGNNGQALNYGIVDKVQSLAGGTATIFVRQTSDFIRISTNVKTAEGARAVGTPLDPNGKAYAAVVKGESFYGAIDILGKAFYAGYEPIKDAKDNVIGIYYVGYPLNGLDILSQSIAKTKLLDSGFIAICDGKNKLLFNSAHILPAQAESIIAGKDQQWNVEKNNENKLGFNAYFAFPQKDLSARLVSTIVWTVIGGLICLILIALVIQWLMHIMIVKPLKTLDKAAEHLAEGRIEATLTVKSRDEFGKLTDSFNKITEALTILSDETGELTSNTADGNLSHRADPEKVSGAYKSILTGFNSALEGIIKPLETATVYMERISKGDIPSAITTDYKGDYAKFKSAINNLISSFSGLVKDALYLSECADSGKLRERADENKYQGDFRRIIDGMNSTFAYLMEPMDIMIDYLNKVSKGEKYDKIEMEFRGDYAQIRSAINNMVDTINGIYSAITSLTESAVNGELSKRAETGKFDGQWKEIVSGINETLDSVIGPLNVAADYIRNISEGNIPPTITDHYNGDFNILKNNLNTCVKAVNNLIDDTMYLVSSAEEGKLEARADASKHRGDFLRIIEGVNGTLDALLHPIDEAVSVLSQMAEGNLSVRMVGQYKGGHATIKNALNRTLDMMPFKEMITVLLSMEGGDLTKKITGDYKGETLELKNALNKTIDSINEILSQVITTVEDVNRGATQVSDASSSLSQGATEQAASLEEITSSMMEIGSQTRHNAENANMASNITLNARNAAEKGNIEMSELSSAMKEINDSSKNISRIIKVIDEIAFQTNLLALNAAVEAARAGRHGKGFAVVAEEVRNLAARSAAAAKETSEMIENSIKTVEKGSTLATRTAEVLEEIRVNSVKAADIVGEISQLSNEQAQGITQISEGLNQIDKVTQTNTASAEQSASASEELSAQSNELRHMVLRFKLDSSSAGNRFAERRAPESRMLSHASREAMEELEDIKNFNFDDPDGFDDLGSLDDEPPMTMRRLNRNVALPPSRSAFGDDPIRIDLD